MLGRLTTPRNQLNLVPLPRPSTSRSPRVQRIWAGDLPGVNVSRRAVLTWSRHHRSPRNLVLTFIYRGQHLRRGARGRGRLDRRAGRALTAA